jgi:hypothetical protein
VSERQFVAVDDVDVALIELPIATPLGPLAPVDTLDLGAPEREHEIVFVLGHVAGQRNGEVEAQRQVGVALFEGSGRLHEIDLPLGLAAGLGEEDVGALEDRGLDGRNPKRRKPRRILSSMASWTACSAGSSSSTPAGGGWGDRHSMGWGVVTVVGV